MSKKEGSILIELVVAIFLLLTSIMIVTVSCSNVVKSVKSRKSITNMNESMDAICSEIKYNCCYESVIGNLDKGALKLDYNEKFMEKLLYTNVFDLDRSNNDNYVELKIEEKENSFVKINVSIKYNEEVIGESIIKAPWMDEI